MGSISPPRAFHLCTLNCRGLGQMSKMRLLQEQLDKIKWDFVALQETKRSGTVGETLPNGDVIYHFSLNSTHGTGFLVSNRNSSNVKCFCPVSSRLSYIDVDIRQNKYRLISAYAPTSSYTDADYNTFLAELDNITANCGPRVPIVAGDFNARLGCRQNQESAVGSFAFDSRNDRGQILLDWLQSKFYRSWSSFFMKKKQRTWTWRAPNGKTLSQIDYVFSYANVAVSDVCVLNNFDYDSDHRLLRAKIGVQKRKRRQKKKKMEKYVDRALFQHGMSSDVSSLHATQSVGNIYNSLVNRIRTAYDVATCQRSRNPFLSDRTIDLLRRRRSLQNNQTVRGRLEFTQISKAARYSRKEDIRRRHDAALRNALSTGRGLRKVLQDGSNRQNKIIGLRDSNGVVQYQLDDVAEIVKLFYNNLYEDTSNLPRVHGGIVEETPPFLEKEILRGIFSLSSGKAPGSDRIPVEALKWSSSTIVKDVTMLFNGILDEDDIPANLMMSRTRLLFKKGDVSEISNYRPITLLNTIYKLLSRCVLNRMEPVLEENLSEQQCGFRKQYGTSDNIHILRQVIEKTREYRMPLFLCFIDLSKAFDRIRHQAIWNALTTLGVQQKLIEVLRKVYLVSECSVDVNGREVPVEIRRGVRQGDVISPRLFTSVLDVALRKLDWNESAEGNGKKPIGIRMNGNFLSHLMFADDCLLLAPNKRTLKKMIRDFMETCGDIGLEINMAKSEYMNNQNDLSPFRFNDVALPPKKTVEILLGIGT